MESTLSCLFVIIWTSGRAAPKLVPKDACECAFAFYLYKYFYKTISQICYLFKDDALHLIKKISILSDIIFHE